MGKEVVCPECGNNFTSIGNHWQYKESHRPELSDYQKEITTGLMMGDGSLGKCGKNPHLTVGSTTKEYLEWLDTTFPILSNGVYLQATAEEKAERTLDSGFYFTAREEDYNDYWKFETSTLPEFKEFDWYTGDGGEKVWPDDIELTSTVLTHWYVGDGHFEERNWGYRIVIGASNEIGNGDKITSYFENVGLPSPSNYQDSNNGMNIQFIHDTSKELFEYMDPAPPGFEYKFPEEYRDKKFYK